MSCREAGAPLSLPPPISLYSTVGRRQIVSQSVTEKGVIQKELHLLSFSSVRGEWRADCLASTTHGDRG